MGAVKSLKEAVKQVLAFKKRFEGEEVPRNLDQTQNPTERL